MADIKFRATLDTGDFDRKLSDATQSVDRLGNEANDTSPALGRLRGALAGVTAVLGVRELINYTNTWTDLRSRVGLAAGDMGRADTIMARLGQIARRTYSDFNQTAEGFLQNSNTLRDLGLSMEQALDYTEALNNAMVVSGAKGQDAERVQRALSDAMVLGGLRGDQLNTILTAGGRVAELLAAELGTTTIGLRQMAADGQITAEVIQNTLLNNMQLLREEAELMPATIGDGFVLMGNAIQETVGKFDQLLGASGAIAGVMVTIADNMQAVISYTLGLAIALGGTYVVSAIKAAVATASLSRAFLVLRGAIISTGIGALAVAIGMAINATLTFIEKVGGLGNAFELVSNVAAEVWDRIKRGASLMGEAFAGVGMTIKAVFADAWATVLEGFANLLMRIQGGVNSIKTGLNDAFTFDIPAPLQAMFGGATSFGGLGLEPSTFGDEFSARADSMRETADHLSSSAEAFNESIRTSAADLLAPLESMEALREATSGATDEAVNLNEEINNLGGGTGGGSASGGSGGAAEEESPIKTLREELDDWAESMRVTASTLSQTISSAYSKMEDALVDFVMTGKLDFKELINSMIADLVRLSIRSMFFGGQGGGGGIFGNLFGGGGSGGGGFLGGIFGNLSSANGNVFGSSGQMNYALGGVMNQKFAFPTGDGRMGYGAESGPEAIMPLSRGKNGKLGVMLAGGSGGGGGQIINQFNTTVNPPPNSTPEDARAFAREFNKSIEAKVVETMTRVQNVGIGGRRR